MRLVSFKPSADPLETAHVGAVDGDRVLDLHRAGIQRLMANEYLPRGTAGSIADALSPRDMTTFIAGAVRVLDFARETLTVSASEPDLFAGSWHDMERLRWLPVIPKPPLIRDFMGFEAHLKNIYPKLGREIPPEWYNLPIYYKGNPQSVGAHGQAIVIPALGDEMDFEFEIAAVIGRGGRNIDPNNAMDHVYGFTIYNDFSARAIQKREMSVGLGPAKGKDFDGAHVFGPYLVTCDEVGDIYSKATSGTVNGLPWCSGLMSDMHWRFEDMIAHASKDEMLHPGEILGSGTVGNGSAAERGESLKAGDRIELTVEGLGTLVNTLVARG